MRSVMRNNSMTGMVLGLFLMTTIVEAQNYSEKEMAIAMNVQKTAPAVIYKAASGQNMLVVNADIVDYPTVSYPETSSLSIEKDKAFYHLSWQVIMPENLSYTEVQSSIDGINFTTVGYVTNERSDYFVPSDKSATSCFRLVQYSMNAQKHISETVKVK